MRQRLGIILAVLATIIVLTTVVGGCALLPDIRHQPQFHNPFVQLRRVAVVPFANQSESPTVDGYEVASAYARQMQLVPGFEVLPIGAVRAQQAVFEQQVLGGPMLRGDDFQRFAQYLGVDALLQGSIVDFDPYYPPRMTLKVNWYAADPQFQRIPVGYGLPWGDDEEKDIPHAVVLESERELAAAQIEAARVGGESMIAEGEVDAGPGIDAHTDPVPAWPDPAGLVPPPPESYTAAPLKFAGPVIEHMAAYDGANDYFTGELEAYYYFRNDARFGGWESYLQRSEDFIAFCCHLHVKETLIARGGQLEKRSVVRWPIRRYER